MPISFMSRTVAGESMRPFLGMFDECSYQEACPSEIRVGDIIVYESPSAVSRSFRLLIHRVIFADANNRSFIVKGDNIPYKYAEKIPFSAVRGKVMAVKRGNRTVNLGTLLFKRLNTALAFLSRYDLTPSLFVKRFVDPVFRIVPSLPFYVSLRRISYGKFRLVRVAASKGLCLYGLIGTRKSSEAVFLTVGERTVVMGAWVRLRDRNRIFARLFLESALEAAGEEFGPDCAIHVDRVSFNRNFPGADNAPFAKGLVYE